jgi:hypothetical protein
MAMTKYIFIFLFAFAASYSCKSHKTVAAPTPAAAQDTAVKTVEIKYAEAGTDAFKINTAGVEVKPSVTFNGVGKAFLCANKTEFETYFSYLPVDKKKAQAIDFTGKKILAIVGQSTEYKTYFTIKSSYSSPEGYVIRVLENQDPNKMDKAMMPLLMLEIPLARANVPYIVFIERKEIPVVGNVK